MPQTVVTFGVNLAMFKLTLFVQTKLDFLSFYASLSAFERRLTKYKAKSPMFGARANIRDLHQI